MKECRLAEYAAIVEPAIALVATAMSKASRGFDQIETCSQL